MNHRAGTNIPALTRQLMGLLTSLIERQTALHAAIADKLSAMRRASVPDMLDASSREGQIVDEILKLDQGRVETAAALAQLLKMPTVGAATTVSLRAIAARLDPANGAQLLQLATSLREKMLSVAKANRVVELVCKEMLAHFKTLFASLIQPETPNQTYSPAGAVDPRGHGALVLDAVV